MSNTPCKKKCPCGKVCERCDAHEIHKCRKCNAEELLLKSLQISERKWGMAQRERFIGDTVKPWGKIAAILWTGGERYYMFLDRHKTVSLIPASACGEGGQQHGKAKG